MSLNPREIRQILTAAQQLPLSAAKERADDFICRVVGLNPAQRLQYFPSPDPNGFQAINFSHLTKAREQMMRNRCVVPTFAVYQDALGITQISGLSTYLVTKGFHPNFGARLGNHEEIKDVLRGLSRGHDLEAVAAAIMKAHCGYGIATAGSGDQGIDAIGRKDLILIDPAFSNGSIEMSELLPGENVFILASSKAGMSRIKGQPKLLNPAHIRELVGGWLVQRSITTSWRESGIRMLSPVQMVLVTTYRLSPDAKADCRSLGIQVWGIPELIFLICLIAPASVFDAQNGYAFSRSEFKSWWKERDRSRLSTTRK